MTDRARTTTQWDAVVEARRLSNKFQKRYSTFRVDRPGSSSFYVVAPEGEHVTDGTLTATFPPTPQRDKQ